MIWVDVFLIKRYRRIFIKIIHNIFIYVYVFRVTEQKTNLCAQIITILTLQEPNVLFFQRQLYLITERCIRYRRNTCHESSHVTVKGKRLFPRNSYKNKVQTEIPRRLVYAVSRKTYFTRNFSQLSTFILIVIIRVTFYV